MLGRINNHTGESMFINNKYSRWYYTIIENRKNNPFNGYVERHHIIPKSLGGNNKKENIVALTAREHFICHRLLVKMTSGRDKMKMSYAIRCLINQENKHQQRYKISSRTYAAIISATKADISKYQSGENNPYYGKHHSNEVREKMRAKRALQVIPTRKGKVYSEETLQRWREGNRKQFEDPYQIELRRTKCNKIQGMKIYHNYLGETKYYLQGTQPNGWVMGRPKKEKEA
jgi:hypothetical protein